MIYFFDKTIIDYKNYTNIKLGEDGKIYRFNKVGGVEPVSKIYEMHFQKLLKYEWYQNLQVKLFKYRKKKFVEKTLRRKYYE